MGKRKKRKPPSPYAPDTDYLQGMEQIIRFTRISRSTFYRRGYDKLLQSSRYIFSRKGRHGRVIWWSYKNLIICWLADNFQVLNAPVPEPGGQKETAPEEFRGGD